MNGMSGAGQNSFMQQIMGNIQGLPGQQQPPTTPGVPEGTMHDASAPAPMMSRPMNENYGLGGKYNTLAQDMSYNRQGPSSFMGGQFNYMPAGRPMNYWGHQQQPQFGGYGGYNPYGPGAGMQNPFGGFSNPYYGGRHSQFRGGGGFGGPGGSRGHVTPWMPSPNTV